MTDSTPARAWRVVLDRIEGDLLEGTLGPGDRLPPERELATTLGVGRSSVREALALSARNWASVSGEREREAEAVRSRRRTNEGCEARKLCR